LWPIYLSGGQVEYILEDLLANDDFRPYEAMWRFTRNARRFLEGHLPFWQMEPADELLSTPAGDGDRGQVFRKRNEVYAVYLPKGSAAGELDLREAEGTFIQRWFDPRAGLFKGEAGRQVQGGAPVALGQPPETPDQDWAVLLRRRPVAALETH
jgi:hypothetical protein